MEKPGRWGGDSISPLEKRAWAHFQRGRGARSCRRKERGKAVCKENSGGGGESNRRSGLISRFGKGDRTSRWKRKSGGRSNISKKWLKAGQESSGSLKLKRNHIAFLRERVKGGEQGNDSNASCSNRNGGKRTRGKLKIARSPADIIPPKEREKKNI